jgi:thiol-disulfide isomerase/thioredoxin
MLTHPSLAHPQKSAPKQISQEEELQQVIDNAGNDRAALVRNLEAFLKKYPEARQRVQIYRALVEASLQLRDNARATEYAERIIALAPNEMSMTVMAIQLLDRSGDEAGLRRATSYASRILEFIDRSSEAEKSPKVSAEEWRKEKGRDRMSILLLRGRLYLKLHDIPHAQSDFEASYAVLPSAGAAEQLGQIAETNKDLPRAVEEYARAFALADASSGDVNRQEIRQRLGNAWRLLHGSDSGLGDYTLRVFDEVTRSSTKTEAKRNSGAKELYDFTLRKVPEGAVFPLAQQKGKVLVVNFWATWCGPCRELEPEFERVSTEYASNPQVVFLAADCDDDEALVGPYLEEAKPKTAVVFADGLDRLFAISAFPTVVVLDRTGKIVYRTEGFDPMSFEESLRDAIKQALPPTS